MANRWFGQFFKTLVKDPVALYGRATFGSTGAVTLDKVNSKGILSVTRTGTGAYTIVLGGGGVGGAAVDTYPRILMFKTVFLNATAPAAPAVYVVSETVKTNGQVLVQFNAAGTATDPGSGEEVEFEITLTNSTAQ